jgi:hypothetical protein
MGDLDVEFCKASIKLLAGLYLSPGSLEIPAMPRVEGQKRVEQTLPFQSRVVEVKLRRAMEQKAELHKQLLADLPKLMGDVDGTRKESNDLTERFLPVPAPRPDKPKYVEWAERMKNEENEEKNRARARRAAIAKKEAELERPNPEFLKRVQMSEAEGQKRARKRVRAIINKGNRPT